MSMAMPETFDRWAPYAERLAENEYLQENLREAVTKLRDAYGRAAKRKTAAAQDKRFYARLREAASALDEAKAAFVSGRTKPKRTKRRLLVVLVGGAGIAAAVAVATNDELRASLLGEPETPTS
jgi:hypothetical protein